ncbi:hypothetical protein [Actimicrobium sp. CCI2.3]|uniref:hypothetical protein n=1 Tax=Actimicrobium sp. CCI2.3 TaxID=3048616 RepID=UPI002AB495BA|nr:hypothetical protein [Actimicrobium sp. CCI2.3]MDY7574798.1 hypothetical protein [Actimicrobium sp. CCI2.3]MEB0020241.1 hypothetical protein [Actimicrobium sp. CCI2.3]
MNEDLVVREKIQARPVAIRDVVPTLPAWIAKDTPPGGCRVGPAAQGGLNLSFK